MNKNIIPVVFLAVGFLIVLFIFLSKVSINNNQSFVVSEEAETITQTITLESDNNEIIDVVVKEKNLGENLDSKSEKDIEQKEIFITDGLRHSVPLKEILGGGPPKDGIPSIDNPKFIPTDEVTFLSDEEPGLAVSINGIDRFYPFQILVWHEIVNDDFAGDKVLVTYCPLCISGVVFDPLVKGERVEFGTSGKLWQSNLVMYDRKTDSYWSQILGEAIVGEMTGAELKVLPSDQIQFGEWKKEHQNGQVLSRETGAVRFYGSDPYGDYYTREEIFFPVRGQDDRLSQKDFVLGIVVNGQAKAYLPESIKRIGELEDNFEGKNLLIKYEPEIDAVRIFEKLENGDLERINPFPNFWFSWVAAHPDTELYK